LASAEEELPYRLVWTEFDAATDAMRDFTDAARRALQLD
jgi:hypothetical protein